MRFFIERKMPVIILDGGLGRQLSENGAPFRQPEWSALALMEAPHTVREVHDQFIAAGADVITTNTYAIVPFHIGEDRYEDQGGALLELAAKLARSRPMDRPGGCTRGLRRTPSSASLWAHPGRQLIL